MRIGQNWRHLKPDWKEVCISLLQLGDNCVNLWFVLNLGKIWTPKPINRTKDEDDFEVELDLEDDYETALTKASESELVDLAGKFFVGL